MTGREIKNLVHVYKGDLVKEKIGPKRHCPKPLWLVRFRPSSAASQVLGEQIKHLPPGGERGAVQEFV